MTVIERSDEPIDLLVVGGGPAGQSAAAAYRSVGGGGRVVILSADTVAPYHRPPLSKDYLRGESEEDELPIEPAEFYRDNNTDVRLMQPVSAIDLAKMAVQTNSGAVRYRSLVLATGCDPAVLPVPGAEHPSVLRLRSLDQARRLRTAATSARTAVVIGSGFIGCEAAASLAVRGIDVTMLSSDELPQLKRLGRSVAERLAGWLDDSGVRLVGNAKVEGIGGGSLVTASGGLQFRADLVLSAAGVTPNSRVAEQAGLAMEHGRVLADQRMATSAPGVFVAGDVALAHNETAGRRLRVEHWGEAQRMGEIAGTNAAGGADSWNDVPGFWSTIGGHTIKYAAWGDGYDRDQLIVHDGGGFTVWYSTGKTWAGPEGTDEDGAGLGTLVGVLTFRADDDYDRGSALIAGKASVPVTELNQMDESPS